MPLNLAVLISGGGRTLQNLAATIDRGELDARVGLVVASNDQAAAVGLRRATDLGLDARLLARRDFPAGDAGVAAYSEALFQAIRDAGCDTVCLAGFLALLRVPTDFAGRVLNIHPALLPSFGGRGMWGHHVHEAVLAAGCKVSGCTVHLCDNTYDTGPILVQRCCPVLDDDTPDTLAARVFEQECMAYPEALRMLAAGPLRVDRRRVRRG